MGISPFLFAFYCNSKTTELQNGCDSKKNTNVNVILKVCTVLLLEEVHFEKSERLRVFKMSTRDLCLTLLDLMSS